jgi:inhibitor of KinA sporulation pathway (predicted exonuclease)
MFVIVDIEATCWEKRRQRDLNELIEIGVVACTDDCEMRGTFSSVVQPMINKQITEQCRKLTGIMQSEIDAADPLPVVIARLDRWFTSQFDDLISNVKWASWGSSDVSVRA